MSDFTCSVTVSKHHNGRSVLPGQAFVLSSNVDQRNYNCRLLFILSVERLKKLETEVMCVTCLYLMNDGSIKLFRTFLNDYRGYRSDSDDCSWPHWPTWQRL